MKKRNYLKEIEKLQEKEAAYLEKADAIKQELTNMMDEAYLEVREYTDKLRNAFVGKSKLNQFGQKRCIIHFDDITLKKTGFNRNIEITFHTTTITPSKEPLWDVSYNLLGQGNPKKICDFGLCFKKETIVYTIQPDRTIDYVKNKIKYDFREDSITEDEMNKIIIDWTKKMIQAERFDKIDF